MPPFVYPQPQPNPYAASISDLMLRHGDIAAQKEIALAKIRANEITGVTSDIAAIPGQIQQQKTEQVKQQLGQQALTKGALDIETTKRAADFQKQLSSAMVNTPQVDENGLKVWDVDAITKGLSASGFGEQALATGQHLSAVNDSMRAVQGAKKAAGQQAAESLLSIGAPVDLTNHVIDTFQSNGIIDAATAKQFKGLITADPANAMKIATFLAGPQKPIVLPGAARPGAGAATLVTPQGQPIATGAPAGPAPPTLPSLALEASGGDAAGAVDLLKPPKPPPVPRPLEEQLYEAIAKGDKTTADQLTSTMQQAAAAKRDPVALAQVAATRALSAEAAQARLDKLKEDAKPLDVTPDTHTTQSGLKYIDLSQYTGNERNKARQAAGAAGIVPVSKEQADALQQVDNARSNQQDILAQIGDALPKDAAARPAAYVSTTLSKLFQTDDQKAAFSSWRSAAINTLRATAGSKGLRINQAEIAQAIENDIPRLTDTLGVAKQKVSNINTMLDNAEKSVLVLDRSVPTPRTPPPAAPPTTPAKLELAPVWKSFLGLGQ